jgi:hypothetical protein
MRLWFSAVMPLSRFRKRTSVLSPPPVFPNPKLENLSTTMRAPLRSNMKNHVAGKMPVDMGKRPNKEMP